MEITKMKKPLITRVISFILSFSMLMSLMIISVQAVAYDPNAGHKELPIKFLEDKKPDVGFYINAASKYLLETVPEPMFGTSFGEWSVMDLLRGMYTGSDYINHIPKDYFQKYIGVIENEMIEKQGKLHSAKYTEYSRLTLPLSALGYDIHNIAPHYRNEDGDVVAKGTPGAKLLSYDIPLIYSVKNSTLYRQGINGPIWTLIAMNTGGYKYYTREQLQAGIDGTDKEIEDKLLAFNVKKLEAESKTLNPKTGRIKNCQGVSTEGKQLDFILSQEITQANGTRGGWALWGQTPDPDITAMALQGLTPYYLSEARFNEAKKNAYSDNGKTTFDYSYKEFKEYVERAIDVLSGLQEKSGGYSSWGSINSESVAQVIVALTGLQMDPMSSKIELPTIGKTCSFIKEGEERDGVTTNNLIDNILTFWAPGSGATPDISGFKHVTAGADGGGGSGTSVNAMATDQALYAIIAYDRFLKKINPLYNMKDMTNGEYKSMKASTHKLTYNMHGFGDDKIVNFSPYETCKIIKAESTKTHIFNGWNTKIDGQGNVYNENDTLSMPDKDVKLYATWTTTPEGKIVDDVIKQIALIGTVALNSEDNIEKARLAYDALNEVLKIEVYNYNALVKAEETLKSLKVENQTPKNDTETPKDNTETPKDDTKAPKETTEKSKDDTNSPKTGDDGLLIPILILLLSAGSVVFGYNKLRRYEK